MCLFVCVRARALVDVGLVEEHGLLDDDFERLDVLFNRDLEAVFKLVHLSEHLPHRTCSSATHTSYHNPLTSLSYSLTQAVPTLSICHTALARQQPSHRCKLLNRQALNLNPNSKPQL